MILAGSVSSVNLWLICALFIARRNHVAATKGFPLFAARSAVSANRDDPKQELNDQLFEAVRKGDAAAVTAALDSGADVNAKFRYGTTALFKAAERGHAEVTKILLDRGADVKVKDTFYGATAMTWALDDKHVEVVRLLLEKGADDVDDVLMSGTRENNAGVVKLLWIAAESKPETLTARSRSRQQMNEECRRSPRC